MVRVHQPQVHLGLPGRPDDVCGSSRHPGQHGVEERVVHHLDSTGRQVVGQRRRRAVHGGRDGGQPARAVVDRVHARGDRQQHLRRADVGGRLLPPDVLFAGLQREPVRLRPVRVPGDTDQPSGQRALQLGPDGDEPRMRTAVEQRDTEALARADRDVGTPFPRRGHGGEGQQVAGRDHLRTLRMSRLGDRAELVGAGQPAAGSGGLDDHGERVARRDGGQQVTLGHLDAQAECLGPGPDHGDGLRQGVGVQQQDRSRLRGPAGQGHGLGHGGRLVQQTRAGDGQTGEIGDQGLEVEQGLQPTLADLGLVRRVRRVPGGVLQARSAGSPPG